MQGSKMTRNRINRNPKLTREQLIEVVKLQQQQVWLLLHQLEVAYKVEVAYNQLEVAHKKIRDQEISLEVAYQKICDQEEEIRSVLRTMEQNDNDLKTFLEHEIKELEEELECPVCLEVAKMAPIYKCQEDHLVCRSQTLSRHHEMVFHVQAVPPKAARLPSMQSYFLRIIQEVWTVFYIELLFGSLNRLLLPCLRFRGAERQAEKLEMLVKKSLNLGHT